MHHEIRLSKRADWDSVLAHCVSIEWPSESAQFVAINLAEVLIALTVFDDFPAHETFTVSDASHSKDFLSVALELEGFFHFDATGAFNLGITEVFDLLVSVWIELGKAFSLVTFDIENLWTSTLQAINNFALEKGDVGVFEVQIRLCFVQN